MILIIGEALASRAADRRTRALRIYDLAGALAEVDFREISMRMLSLGAYALDKGNHHGLASGTAASLGDIGPTLPLSGRPRSFLQTE